jgi:hypothetical protein
MIPNPPKFGGYQSANFRYVTLIKNKKSTFFLRFHAEVGSLSDSKLRELSSTAPQAQQQQHQGMVQLTHEYDVDPWT